MRILFINTHFYMPQSFGGMSVTLHQLCQGLIANGHEVSVLAGYRRAGLFGFRSSISMRLNRWLHGASVSRDIVLGYRVWRSWVASEAIAYVAAQEKPDAIVLAGGKIVPAARAARKTGIPLLMQVHDVEMHFHGGDFNEVRDLPCVANSRFTADVYAERFGVKSSIILPFIDADQYKVEPLRRNVTFVNPYVHKGLNVALGVAKACPDIPFTFVGNVPTDDGKGGNPFAEAVSLPNVTLLPPQSDMRGIYGQAKILFAPSQWEEAYGRVASEAQVSGIPVLGSTQGGMPEAIGDGGILLPATAPIEQWCEALQRLWSDSTLYHDLSDRASRWALRPELELNEQIAAHEAAINKAVSSYV